MYNTPYRRCSIRRIQEVGYAVSIPAQENSGIFYSWSPRQATLIRRIEFQYATGGIVISEPVSNTVGKSSAVIQKLIDQSGQPDVGYRSAAPHTDEFVSFFVTPTSDHEFQDDSDSIQSGNPQTRRALERYIEIGDAAAAPVDNTEVVSTLARDTEATFLLKNGVRTSSVPGNEAGGMIDHMSPPGFWASLRNRHDLNFLDLLNVSSAQYVGMVSELRLWYEHEILIRGMFKQKFTQSSKIVQQRDAEIVALKAKVGEAECAITEVNGLRGRISELEAATVAKSKEVSSLSVQNVELLGKVSGLELVCDGLKGQVTKLEADYESLHSEVAGEARLRVKFASIQDVEARRFKERSAELDARIVGLKHDIDAKLYTHMLTIVVGRRWEGLEAGIEHGKVGRSLAEIDDYDSRVGATYVAAVNEFENVSFTLLEQLEALKDSPFELFMSALTLKGDYVDEDPTPEFRRLQPGADLVVADHQVSSATNIDGTVPSSAPHDELCDATILDRPIDS
ncbi:hypothetical protein Tco_0277537 [Tanacetum coccineum]